MAGNRLSLKEKLYNKTVEKNGCLIWTGAKDAKGYGKIRIDGHYQSAHRVMYQMSNGPIPDGLVVMHSCDTPSCVNPDHLSAGTQLQNVRDMFAKGRAPIRRGERGGNSKLSTEQINQIRARFKSHDRKHGLAAIAKDYGVHRKTIQAVVHGDHWSSKPDISGKQVTFNGESLSVAAWSRKTGIGASTIHARLAAGWTVDDALSVKPERKNRVLP